MIGVDTAALIDLFRKKEPIVKLLESIEGEVVLNQISYLELMFGLDSSVSKHKEEELFYDGIFDNYENLSLNTNGSKKSSEILHLLKKKGKIIELFDCTIAGIYLANGVDKIITNNVKHFENIEGLEVISY